MLIGSVIIHELAHGIVAGFFGDPTARRMGRITLNPIPHLDPVGSVILPLLMVVLHSPVWFAWAKPVPINTALLRNPIPDMMWIALAGPLSNISLACLASLILRVPPLLSVSVGAFATSLLVQFIVMNIGLAVFNLIPIPPLDGSRILIRFLPDYARLWMIKVEPFGLGILLGMSFLGLLSPIVMMGLRLVVPWFIYGI